MAWRYGFLHVTQHRSRDIAGLGQPNEDAEVTNVVDTAEADETIAEASRLVEQMERTTATLPVNASTNVEDANDELSAQAMETNRSVNRPPPVRENQRRAIPILTSPTRGNSNVLNSSNTCQLTVMIVPEWFQSYNATINLRQVVGFSETTSAGARLIEIDELGQRDNWTKSLRVNASLSKDGFIEHVIDQFPQQRSLRQLGIEFDLVIKGRNPRQRYLQPYVLPQGWESSNRGWVQQCFRTGHAEEGRIVTRLRHSPRSF